MPQATTKPLTSGSDAGAAEQQTAVVGAVHMEGIGAHTFTTVTGSSNSSGDDVQEHSETVLVTDAATERMTASTDDEVSSIAPKEKSGDESQARSQHHPDGEADTYLAEAASSILPPSGLSHRLDQVAPTTSALADHNDINSFNTINSNNHHDELDASSIAWSAMPGPVPPRLQIQEPFFIAQPSSGVISSSQPVDAELAFRDRAELEAHITRQVEADVTERLERQYRLNNNLAAATSSIPLVLAEFIANNNGNELDQGPDHDENNDEESSDASEHNELQEQQFNITKRNRLICILVLPLVLIGIGVGIFISQLNQSDGNSTTTIIGPTYTNPPTGGNNPDNQNSPTPAPSQNPAQISQIDELLQILEPHITTNCVEMIVADETSFRYRALKWLADVDQWRPLEPERLDQPGASIQYFERYVATVLYYTTLGDTNWESQLNFLNSSLHHCDWHDSSRGIRCDLKESIPDTSERRGLLSYIKLGLNSLGNTLPLEIYDLVQLKQLTLEGNFELGGTISTRIGILRDLIVLEFSETLLSSKIPSEIGLLTGLIYLSMTETQVAGTIPTEIGLLRSVQLLALDSSMLSGFLPTEIGTLTSIEELYLNANDQLSGKLPSEIGLLTQLQHLHLQSNFLDGTVPTELGNLSNTRTLVLSDNSFSGPVPSELGNLGNSLKVLVLLRNRFEGTIPTDFARLINLESFALDHNPLLQGNLDPIFCHNAEIQLERFWSDCRDTIETDGAEIVVVTPSRMICSCCTYCCDNGECPTQEPYNCDAKEDSDGDDDWCIRCGLSQALAASCDMCPPFEDLFAAGSIGNEGDGGRRVSEYTFIASPEQAGCLGACRWNDITNICESRS